MDNAAPSAALDPSERSSTKLLYIGCVVTVILEAWPSVVRDDTLYTGDVGRAGLWCNDADDDAPFVVRHVSPLVLVPHLIIR